MSRIISLEEARQILGEDTVIALEDSQHWVFDPSTGNSGRVDDKFYRLIPTDELGYPVTALEEEPQIPYPADGSPRIIGQLVVEINHRGFVHTRLGNGFGGAGIELFASSISKGEIVPSNVGRHGKPYRSNKMRIKGFIVPVLKMVDFPDEEGMTPQQFVDESDDGRSITALAKLGLLKGVEA